VIKHLELLSRWKEFWNYIGGTTDPRPIYEKLAASYSEPHRAYHNLTHLHECLVALDASAVEPASARIVEVALWFHDSVYDPKAGDNEEQSAEPRREDPEGRLGSWENDRRGSALGPGDQVA
jgi:predicted metal-dependent HD superfamily phosphohydrolase